MSQSKACGTHTPVASNENVRISQCACGVYHVSFTRKGVSIQLGEAEMRALAETSGIAIRIADAESRGRAIVTDTGRPTN